MRGLSALLEDHTGFCIMFVVVLFAVAKLTPVTAKSITYATAIWAVIIIGVTGFPFWPQGETLSNEQLVVGSIASFAVIAGLGLLFDRSFFGKSMEERRQNWG